MSDSSTLDVEPFRQGFRGLLPEHIGVRLVSVEPDLIVAEIDVDATNFAPLPG